VLSEPTDYLRSLAAFLAVLALALLLAWLARRFLPALATAPGTSGRLGVVAMRPLDPRHKLVLVRRDGVEHLLGIGPGGLVVIETLRDAGPGSVP
jgi:flagellar protein FliO/FliZ